MICRNCGAELPDQAKFCTKCGSKQSVPTPAVPELRREAAEAPVSIPQSAAADEVRIDPDTGRLIQQTVAQSTQPAAQNPRPAAQTLRFDPRTGQPVGQNPQPAVQTPRFDPRTGQPVGQNPQPAVQAPRFDPRTGQPVGQNPQPAVQGPRFDPRTGQPVGQTAQPAVQGPRFDPRTGQPIGQNPQPVVSRQEPKPQKVKQPKPQRSRIRAEALSGGKKAVAVILCVFVVLFGLLAGILGVIRGCYNKDSIRTLVEKANLSRVRMPGADGSEVSLARFVAESCQIDFQEEYGISEQELGMLLDQPFVRQKVGQILGNYAAYLIDGEALVPLTRNDVVDFLRDNDREIKRLTGYSFIETEYAGTGVKSSQYLDAYSLDGIFDTLGSRILSAEVLERQTGLNLSTVRTLLSPLLFYGLLAAALLCLIGLVIVLWGWFRAIFLRTGVSAVILGALNLLLGGAGLIALKKLGIGLGEVFAGGALVRFLILGGALLVLGVGLLFIRKAFPKTVEGEN